MGAFDDLIPQSGAAGGAFDDLIPTEKPKKKRGIADVVADLGVSVYEGAKSTARMVGAAGNTVSGDLADVEDYALRQQAAQEKRPEAVKALNAEIERRKQANPNGGVLDAVRDVGGAMIDNPEGSVQFVAEQAPNSAVALGAGLAGAKLGAVGGSVFGPVGTAVGGIGGFLGGMFLGNTALETGGKAIEKAEGGFTEAERGEAIKEGAIKGGVITAVDAATLGLGNVVSKSLGKAAINAGARAEARVLADAGVDLTSRAAIETALAKSPALREAAKTAGEAAAKAASTLGSKAAMAGTGLTMETVGEGGGEYLGELAATGKADVYDAVMEAAAGFSQSAPEVAWNMRQASSNDLNAKNIQRQGEGLSPSAAPATAAPAPAPGQPPAAAPAAPAATAAPTNPATRLAELELTAEQRDLTDAERQEAATLYQQLTADDEQDAPQAAAGAEATQAPADQAPQAVGGEPAGPATGIPDEGSGYAVEAAGVEPEPVDLTPKEVRTPNRDGSVTVSTWTPQPDGRMVRNVRVEPAGQQANPAAQAPAPAPAAPEPIAATEPTEERILPPLEQGPDQNLQNRDRKRAASVAQMSDIARNPDYMRLGPSRTPDSGAPMVFAVSDDTKDIAPEAFGRQDVAVMSDGQQVPFRYAVVDASKVNPSNFADGRTNPDFSSSVPGTIKALNNGRTAGVRAAHEMGTSGQYIEQMKADAALHGIAPDVIARTPNPILVRVYSDADNTAGMAAKSQGQGLGMSPSELARQDAPLMDTSVLAVYQDGEITSAANRDFVRAFVGKLQGSGQDVAGMMTAEGELSQDGRKRIQAALMQAAYGDSDLVEEMFDSTDTDIKAIGEALKLTAGQWANMRDSARLAAINPEVDITENLLQVIGLIRKARRDRVALSDLVNQPDLMTGETPAQTTVAMLRLFYDGEHFTRAVGKDRLAKHLQDYVRAAMTTTADAGMFGDQVGPRDILKTFAPQGVPDAQAQPVNTGDEPGSRSPAGGDTAAGVQGEQQQQPAQGGRGPAEGSGESGRGTGAGEGQQQAGPADQNAARDDDGAQALVTPGYSELGAEPTQAERAAAAKLLPVGTVVRAKHMAEDITGEVTTSEPSDQYDDKRPYVVIRWSDGGKPRKLGATNGSQAFIHGFFARDGKLYTEGSPSSGMKAEWEVLQAAKPKTQPKAQNPVADDWRDESAKKARSKIDANVRRSIETSTPVEGKAEGQAVRGWQDGVQRRVARWGLVDNATDEAGRITLVTGGELQHFYYKKDDSGDRGRAVSAAEAWAKEDGKQAAPAKKPQKPAKGAAPREADHTGKPKDGNPVMPGDTFRTSSGRITTAYPKQQGAKYASQWLINNAVMEAESRGDSFNMRAFKATSPFKDGTLATADQESMLEYLFGQQPAVVPSILKPLTGRADATPAQAANDADRLAEIQQSITARQAEFDAMTSKPGFDENKALRLAQHLTNMQRMVKLMTEGKSYQGAIAEVYGDSLKKFTVDDIGKALAGNQRLSDGTTLVDLKPAEYGNPLTDYVKQKIDEAKAAIDREKLVKDFRTFPTLILNNLLERGDMAKLYKAAGAKGASAFDGLAMDDKAAAYVKFVEQGGKPVENLPKDYNAWVRSQERDIEVRRLQSDRVVRQENGKPFKTKTSAQQFQERYDLTGTHEVVEANGGFELRQLSMAAQAELKRKTEGRESYTDAQAAAAAEMGIGTNADGEWDATDAQFDEMERRTQARMRGEPTEPILTAPTQEEVVARQDAAEAAQREQEAADRKAAEEEAKRREREEVRRRSDAAADTFELGMDPMANLTGQQDIFSAAPAPAPAVSANTIFTEDAAARARERLKKKLGQLNSGLDPEMMMDGITLAGYHIEKGARTFAAYARAMLGDLGDGVRPYLKSWYMGVKYDPRAGGLQGMDDAATVEAADVETITENDDVPGANGGVESDRGDAAAGTTVGDPVPSEQQGTAVRTGRNGGQAAGESGRGQQNRPGVPAGGATADGERSDFLVPGGNATVDAADVAAGADFSERGSDIGFDGVSTDPVPATQVDAAAETGNDSLSKLQRQRAAEKVPVKPGDLDNIKATLPYLLEGQQEDVKKAEDRFAVPDGYGMLFTNGTGTGKTFTGLGVVKRLQRQGKTNTLIVVPDDKIAADWIESGEPLGLKITPLKDTKDAGSGITIATYANLGENDALATRAWDLVVADEAHSLMQSADGKVTTYLANLRAITHHPDGAYQRHTMLNRADIDKLKELSERIEGNTKILNNTDTMDEMMVSVRQENERLQREADALAAKLREASEAVRAEVASMQGPKRARLLALSATPFAYEFTVDWGNGYLFDYNEGQTDESKEFRGYNQGSNRERFFMTHFGYSMRYNKLTKPDPSKVDTGLLQRNFNGWLRKKGSLSARMLDVPADYDRRFVLVDSGIGNQIDDALNWVSEMSREGENKNGFSALRDVINDKFDYLSRRYLLEAIKASEVVPIVRQHMAMGRKVVVFHDYKKGGGFNPFNIEVPGKAPEDFPVERLPDFEAYKSALTEFRAKFKSLVDAPLGQLPSPIAVFKREFPDVLLVNGDEKKGDLLARYKRFQDDASGPQVMLVQSAKNKGWSGHDTTGKHQRVLINLGQPTAPTLAIQQEGRIYRTGQVSNAIMRYLNTGTSWEKWTFASTIAGRASTAENLGMGEQARALKDAFIAAFEESDAYPPGHEGEGTGGKERDKLANADITAYDRAKTYYWATQKKNSKTKAQEGVDYFATPEPVGFKMAEWLQLRGGESSLEPSAGHGAIARWLPEITNRTVIEPSNVLRARLAMAMDASKDRIIDGRFEDHAIVNKYDGIVMNPPFGVGGKTAVEHLAKAATHLRDGGRIVALIPTGPAADKRFDQWMYGTEQRPVKPLMTDDKLGPIYAGDTIKSRASWAPEAKVVRVRDGALWVKVEGKTGESLVNLQAVTEVQPTGQRSREVRPADGIYTVGEIRLPQVTFERAGTAVATRIVILEKQTDKARAPNARSPIDLTGITDIKELFDRLEDINMPQRAMTAEQEAAAKAEEPKAPASKAEAKADKPKAANPEAVGTVDRGELPIVEHTTTKGKVIRGVIRTDLTKEQAQAIDPYTWKKDGGYFIREVYLKKDGAGESPAFSRQLPKFSRNAVAQSLSVVEADVSSMLKGLENPPNVVVAFDMNDPAIPAEVRAEDMKQRSGGASGSPEGFYYRGTAYIIASQMKSPADTARVFAHEVLGHYGLRTLFGKELKPILRQIIEARPQEVAAKLKEYGLRGVTDLDKMTAAEEVLAEMAQTKPELGFVKRAVAAIRTWLRNNVPGLKNLPMSDAEIIRNYILPARGWVERGERAMRLDGQVAFNRGAAVAFADIAAHFERYPSRPPSGMSSDEAKTYLRDRRASMEALVASYEPRAEGLLMPVRGNGGFWGVTREARPDGDEWRVTRFDQNMEPQGHEAHRSARDAVADVLNWVDVGRISQASMFSRAQDQTQTPEFKRWFGDSKVVDAEGKPLVVYHGTVRDFSAFAKKGVQPNFTSPQKQLGFFFTDDPSYADRYTKRWGEFKDGANTMPVYLSLQNPKVEPIEKIGDIEDRMKQGEAKAYRAGLEAQGFDGIVFEGETSVGFVREFVAFRPEQIKSAIGNNGDFDAGNPDIRFSRSTMGGNPAPQPQQPNKWQQLKQRVMELTSGANIDKLIYEFQDKNIDLKRLRDHIKELGGTITDLNDAYLGEELFHKRVAKRTEDFLQEELRPLLADLRKRGVAMEAFERYLHARHAPEANKVLAERNPNQATIDAKKDETSRQVRALELQLQRAKAQGTAVKALEQALDMARAERARWIGAEAFKGTEEERLSLSGMTDAESAAILSGLNPREQADMEALAARVDAINTRTMDTLERYGLMDRTALDAWRNTYKFYIPLHRDEAHPDSVSHPIGQGFSTKGEASKRRTGSNAKVTNILGHIAMQRETALTRGEKNVVAKKLYLMAAQNPDPEYWEADKVPTQKVVDKDTGLVRTQVDPTYRNKPNVVMVRIAGKDHAIVFNERNPNAVRLAQSLKGQDIGDVDVVTNIVSKGTRWFASVNTQYNPLFGLVNFARDVQAAILQLSTTPLAGKEREVSANTMPALKGIYQEIRQRRKTGARGTGQWARLWEQMQDDGGTTGYRELFTKPDERVKQLTKELKSLDRGQASQLAHALVDWLSDYNEVMENAVRLSAYKTALDMGMSRERAASVAKNLTVNFNRRGRSGSKLGMWYAFLNASIQGTTRLVQTLRGPMGKKIMAGGVSLGAVSTMIGMAVMGGGDDGEDDNWAKIPDFVKERSLIIPLSHEDYITIPMPLGYNVLHNIGRKAVEMATHDDPTKSRGRHLADLARIVLDSFNPMGGSENLVQMLAPTVFDPAVALLQNRDWTGKPIYREDTSGLDPSPGHTRTKDTASTFSKVLSEAINKVTGGTDFQPGLVSWTPDQIDYVIGQLTGGVGRELMKVEQTVTAPLTGEDLPAHKIPLVGRLYGNTRGPANESEQFYENVRDLNGVERELKGRARAGEDVTEYMAENPLASLVGSGNAAERALQEMRAARREVMRQGGPGSLEQARQINQQMGAVMKELNRQVRQAKTGGAQ